MNIQEISESPIDVMTGVHFKHLVSQQIFGYRYAE